MKANRYQETCREVTCSLIGAKLNRDTLTLVGTCIEDIFFFTYEKHIITHETIRTVSRELISRAHNSFSEKLQMVDTAKLQLYRKQKKPCFIFKYDETLWACEIPKDTLLANSYVHQCASNGRTCHRLLSLPDEDGGCAKVRGRASQIELYPFIYEGYETINTRYPALIVLRCDNCSN